MPRKNSKQVRRPTRAKAVPAAPEKHHATAHAANRLSLFIYWMIILFFVSATFYILGRSQEILKHGTTPAAVEIIDGKNLDSLTDEQKAGLADKYAALGKSKFSNGDYDGAAQDLSVALEAAPLMVDGYNMRGEAFMQTGDYSRAEEDMTKAIELDANNSIAYYDRAILNMRLEKYDAARTDLGNAMEALERKPSEIVSAHDIYAKRGQLSLWEKDWSGAISDYSLAISQKTDNYEDFAGRAEAYTAQSAFEPAADDYLNSVRIIAEQISSEPDSRVRETMSRQAIGYFQKLAAIHVKMGALDQAKSDLESAKAIAIALGDTDQTEQLDTLLSEIQ